MADPLPTFDDLQFDSRPRHKTGLQALAFFPNGYGASVICGPHSYGGPEGLYELAVLRGVEGDFDLTYDTAITDDVEGHLSPADVTRLLGEIAALAPAAADAAQ